MRIAGADPGIEGVIPIPVDANHIPICKLDARDTLVFSSVANFVRELSPHTPRPSGGIAVPEVPGPARGRLRVFISYSHRSAEEVRLANALLQALSGQGHAAFIDRGMTVGTDWSQEIFKQINACDFFIVLLSENSAQSEMVQTEVLLAHQGRRKDGRPVILPVRVRFSGQLDYELESYLSRIQYTVWNEPSDTDRAIRDILNAIAVGGVTAQETKSADVTAAVRSADPSRPMPSVDRRLLRTPGGVLSEDDPYYVERPQDGVIEDMAAFARTTLIIRAPRQMGKSSLLLRYLAACRKEGKHLAHIDLQTLTGAELSTYPTFLQAIAGSLLRRLQVDHDVSRITTTLGMTYFVEDVLTTDGKSPLVMAIDEADRALGADWKHDFFSMLRAWHNRREEMDSRLKGLDIALVIATDPFLLIDDANQSPFSVGTVLSLEGFNQAQMVEVSKLYGSPLTPSQCAELWRLFEGQPYLTRLFLYRLRSRDAMAFDDLVTHAADIDGPFGEHLRSKLLLLQRQPELIDAFRAVLHGYPLKNESIFDRLHAAGLVSRGTGLIRAANLVYAKFFGRL
jgi:AAA-like domain/TIR domain